MLGETEGQTFQKHSGYYQYNLCTTCFNIKTSLYMAFIMYVWYLYDLQNIHWLFPDTLFNPLIFVIEIVSVFYELGTEILCIMYMNIKL